MPSPAPRDQFPRAYDDHGWDVYGFFGYRLRSREQAETGRPEPVVEMANTSSRGSEATA